MGGAISPDNQQAQFGGYTTSLAIVPAVIRNYPTPPGNDRAADWDPGTDFARNDKFYQASSRIDYNVTDAIKITSLTSYSHLSRYSPNDTDATALTGANSLADGPHQLLLSRASRFRRPLFASKATTRRQLWARQDIRVAHQRNHGRILEQSLHHRTRDWDDEGPRRYAAFGALDYKLLETVTVQGSVRYSKTDDSYAGCSRGFGADNSLGNLVAAAGNRLRGYPVAIPPGTCATLGPAPTYTPGLYVAQLNQDNVAWRVNVNWQVTPTSLLYANISRGYKEGGFPLSGASFFFLAQSRGSGVGARI